MPNNFLLGLIVAILGALFLRFTSFGRVTLAVGNNEEVARGNGLKVNRNKVTVFVLAGAISGIAGIVATIQLGAVNPTIAAGNLFIALPAVVIGGTSLAGGKGSMLGTVLGLIGFMRVVLWSQIFPEVYGVHYLLIASVVGVSLIGVVMFGTISGSMLPIVLKRLGADPAVSSAPFVATLVDVTGVIIYFNCAYLFLKGTML
jgi:ribose/xylose/arabinose/galactoside ABC-type transport system permease subunit